MKSAHARGCFLHPIFLVFFILMNVFIHNVNGSSLFCLKHDCFYVIVIISFLNVNNLHKNNSFSQNKNRSASLQDVDQTFSQNKNGSASSLDADLNFSQ